jgi:microcystin-dependent protein
MNYQPELDAVGTEDPQQMEGPLTIEGINGGQIPVLALFNQTADTMWHHFVDDTGVMWRRCDVAGTPTVYYRYPTDLTRTDESDVATIRDIRNIAHPVGSLYTSATDTNPAATLGFGSWSAWGAGRAMVGVGDAGLGTNWTAGLTKGAETHTLTTAQMPYHTHSKPAQAANSGGESVDHLHTLAGQTLFGTGGSTGSGPQTTANSVYTSGNSTYGRNTGHIHATTMPAVNVSYAGSGASHNNIQPSQAAYIWQRTA